MTYGITPTGFNRKTLQNILDEIAADLRRDVSENLILDENDPVWVACVSVANQLSLAWEVLEDTYRGLSRDDATGESLAILGRLTGYRPTPAQRGQVRIDLTSTATTPIGAGDVLVSVAGQPSNQWRNVAAFTPIVGTNAGVLFESVGTGSAYYANAGTLTVLNSPPAHITAATNPDAATAGVDVLKDDAIRLEQEANLSARGASTAPALKAAIEAVPGVIAATIERNSLDVTVGAIPPRGIRAIVWAGPSNAADVDAIAQAMAEHLPALTTGGAASGTATINGVDVTLNFDWALEVPVYVNLTIAGKFDPDAVRAAILAAHNGTEILSTVVLEQIKSLCWVPGVTDIAACGIGLAFPGTGANLTIPVGSVPTFAAARIQINGIHP